MMTDNIDTAIETKTNPQPVNRTAEELQHLLKAINTNQSDINEIKLNDIVKHSAHPSDVYYQVGLTYFNHHHRQKACHYFEKAKKLSPENITILFALAQSYEQLNQIAQAITYYQQILSLNPDHTNTHACLSLAYYQTNQLAEAKTATINWIKNTPNMAAAYNLLGSIYLKSQTYDEAISQFKQAIQFDITHYDAMVNLGQCYLHFGDYAQADQYLFRALKMDPNQSMVHVYYGLSQLNQRAFMLSKKHLETAIALDPNNALAHANLSVVLQSLFCFGSSNKAMRMALQKNRTDPHFYTQFASNLLWQNHPEKTILSCQRALQLTPDYSPAQTLLGEAQLQMGDYSHSAWSAYMHSHGQSPPLLKDCPEWNGKPFPGKLLLVHWDIKTEEAILLLRYLPLLYQYGHHIAVACPEPLMPIIKLLSCVKQVFSLAEDFNKQSAFALQLRASQLPHMLAEKTKGNPPTLPEYSHESNKWSHCLAKYGQPHRLKIGFATMGAISPNPAQDVPFGFFTLLARYLKRADRFNLTPYQNQTERQTGEALGIYDTSSHELTLMCAMIDQLDILITSDNLVAHLAGMRNKTVYVILPFTAKWYWKKESNQSLWYPTARIYQQTIPKKWKPVADAMLKDIQSQFIKQG